MNPLLNWLRNYWLGKERQVVADYQKRFHHESLSMEDLRIFCNVYETTHRPGDPYATHVEEGKRQVYNHIVKMLSITDDEIKSYYQQLERNNVDERASERPRDTSFDT